MKLLRGELADAAADGAWRERDSRLADLRAEGRKWSKLSIANRCAWRSTRTPSIQS